MVSTTISGTGDYIRAYAGGLVGGQNSRAAVYNCYNIGTVTSINTAVGNNTENDIGGLIGQAQGGDLYNCYWLSSVAELGIGNNINMPYRCDSFENISDTVNYIYDQVNDERSLLAALNGYPIFEELHIHDNITFTPWFSTDILPTTSGNYYLVNDVTLSDDYYVPEGVSINLCLNDRVISVTNNIYYMGVLPEAELTIYDCGTAERSYSESFPYNSWALDEEFDETETTMLTTGGVITGMTFNGGIINLGKLTINGKSVACFHKSI